MNININILTNDLGTGSVSQDIILREIYNQTGTSSLSLIGFETHSNYTRCDYTYDALNNTIDYLIKPTELLELQDRTIQTLIAKNGLKVVTTYENNRTIYNDVILNEPYPFNIEIEKSGSNFGLLKFSRFDGINKPEITSNVYLEAPYTYHFICQKTGSQLEMYIDGVLISSCSDYSDIDVNVSGGLGDTHNTCELFIGQNGDGKKAFKGSLDEIKILNKALTPTQTLKLAQNELTGSYNYIVGNVFYEYGLITIACPNRSYSPFTKQTPITPVVSSSDYVLDGGVNIELILTDIGGGFYTASYDLYPPMSGGYTISGSYPYWPQPFENYPTNNYVDGGDVTSSYISSQSYDGSYPI